MSTESRSYRRVRRFTTLFAVILALSPLVSGWSTASTLATLASSSTSTSTAIRRGCSSSSLNMNMLSDIGDMLSGGKLAAQGKLPHGEPLAPVQSEVRTLAIAERGISFTGEDFDVVDLDSRQPYARVRGAMMHLPGKDKMRVLVGDNLACELDRKLVAVTPTYDIYRATGEKMGWIEKAVVALTDSFHVHLENDFAVGPFKQSPAFTVEGDFIDRRFVVKNRGGETVAKVTKDGWLQFDAFNHYQVQLAPGMDAALVIACACAIDEEFDEEHAERAKKQAQ